MAHIKHINSGDGALIPLIFHLRELRGNFGDGEIWCEVNNSEIASEQSGR
jgi:hypothetical protein